MATVKISALPAAASVALADIVPIVKGGVTNKATFTQVRAALLPAAVASDISGLAGGIATWLTTPSSANLLAALTDKTGTGSTVFQIAPTFKTTITLRNPADTFSYIFTPAAIAADRILNLPLMTGTDTIAVLALAQTLTNKTIVAASNTITDTSAAQGDVLVHNGTRFVRLALGTSGFFLKSNGTTAVWAAGAGGAASAGGAGQVQASDGAGGFTAPADVLAGTDFVSIGATPALTGNLRLPNLGAIISRDAGNATDLSIAKLDASNYLQLGAGGGALQVRCDAEDIILGTAVRAVSSTFNNTYPIVGSSSAYGVHGESTTNMNNVGITAAASDYMFGVIKVTSTPTAFTTNRTLTMPAPGSDAVAYCKFYRNAQAGAFNLVISTGAGTTVPIAQGKGAWVMCDTTGAVRMSADV